MATCSCPNWTDGWVDGDWVTYLKPDGTTVSGPVIDLTPSTHSVWIGLPDGSKALAGGHGSADTFVSFKSMSVPKPIV